MYDTPSMCWLCAGFGTPFERVPYGYVEGGYEAVEDRRLSGFDVERIVVSVRGMSIWIADYS